MRNFSPTATYTLVAAKDLRCGDLIVTGNAVYRVDFITAHSFNVCKGGMRTITLNAVGTSCDRGEYVTDWLSKILVCASDRLAVIGSADEELPPVTATYDLDPSVKAELTAALLKS